MGIRLEGGFELDFGWREVRCICNEMLAGNWCHLAAWTVTLRPMTIGDQEQIEVVEEETVGQHADFEAKELTLIFRDPSVRDPKEMAEIMVIDTLDLLVTDDDVADEKDLTAE